MLSRRTHSLLSAAGALAVAVVPAFSAVPSSFDTDVKPILETYCYECHGEGSHKGGLALDETRAAADAPTDRKIWETVLHHVRTREMPPEESEGIPTDAERDRITEWIERELLHFDAEHPDPGRVTLRRLNRAEYNATIRDLVGVDFRPANDFPPDDSGYGFDNNGDVLSLPPVLLEKYLAAADKILDQAIVTDAIRSEVRHIPASLAQVGFNAIGDRGDGWLHLISLEEDDAAVELDLPAGDYLFRVQAYATKVGGAVKGQGSETPIVFTEDPGPTKLALMLNDALVKDFTLTTDEAHPEVYEARVGIPTGRQRFRASVARKRGGADNETYMLNGRIGRQQPGIVFVKWLEIEGPLPAATRRHRADKLAATGENIVGATGDRVLKSNGEVSVTFSTDRDTEVILRAQAFAQQAGEEPARMQFLVDGEPVQSFDVLAPATVLPLPKQRVFSTSLLMARPYVYEVRTKIGRGEHRFSAAFVNDFADPDAANPNLRDRNLILQHLEVADLSQKVLTPGMPEPIAKLFAKTSPGSRNDEPAAARAILASFARRAWRRPVAPAEIDRLIKLFGLAREHGDSFAAGVKLGMKATLVSPHFLFLGDTRAPATVAAAPVDPAYPNAVPAQPLDEFALASRLSYFLWSSMPDDELLNLADKGELRAQLPGQVRRMLESPKARALVDNFAGQWLQIRSLETFQPDHTLFPDFDPALRAAMQRETETFFEHVMREDRSVFDFLTGDYTFVNARLAKFYGLPPVAGEEFQKVSIADTPRRGVLTHASVLTLTSNPTRTSPVKRGKWVLENLLGTPPPPPPPNVPELDDKARMLTGTLRQQMEEHRKNSTCASCHARMDPIGFGLENFDAIGAWREKDGGAAIDSSGKLVGGSAFNGAADLVGILARDRRREFLNSLAEKMLTYALGRGTEFYDRPALEQIVKSLDHHQDHFSALIIAVAQSFPFQMRRADSTPVAPATSSVAVSP